MTGMTVEEFMAAVHDSTPPMDPLEAEPIRDPASGDYMYPAGADTAGRREPTLAELAKRMFG